MPDHTFTLDDLIALDGDALKEALVAVLQAWDVPLFNEYRLTTDYQRIDLSDAHLYGANLSHAHLSHAILTDADLSAANLSQANLRAAILRGANLFDAHLSEADLSHADLSDANLRHADLSAADLYDADLSAADLYDADLSAANLSGANLRYADLRGANLIGTNLRDGDLRGANLRSTRLPGADFTEAWLWDTTFSNVDLSEALNLELTRHQGPSTVGIDTLYKSKGKIPREFLEGCGVPDVFLQNMGYVIEQDAITYNSCFISYSHKDEDFARHLHMNLRAAGVRVWYAPEDMKFGDKTHEQIHQAIHLHDRLLVVLSPHSLRSNWVKNELRWAFKKQHDEGRKVLFPISLLSYDDLGAWGPFMAHDGVTDLAQEIREYFIGDFSEWEKRQSFQPLFDKLLASLKAAAG